MQPFHAKDEWYYNERFRADIKGIAPILVTVPPANTVLRDSPRGGNSDVRSKIGQPQIMVWAYERSDGGRGVGFPGGHYHTNLGDDNFRKLVLNAILWMAKIEVPPGRVVSTVTPEELAANLDHKTPRGRGGAGRGAPQLPPAGAKP